MPHPRCKHAGEEFSPGRPLPRRWVRGLWRRAAGGLARLTGQQRPPAAEAALRWLASQAATGRLRPSTRSLDPCPGLTGAALGTLSEFGEQDIVERCVDWLLSIQRADGAFPDALGKRASPVNTALVLGGLLAIEHQRTDVAASVENAAQCLCDVVSAVEQRRGRRLPGGGPETQPAAEMGLVSLVPLAEAVRRLARADWRELAARAINAERRKVHPGFWAGSDHRAVQGVEALLELGYRDDASRAMQLTEQIQRRDGSVPATLSERWVSSRGLAQLAALWYKLGRLKPANRAMACLVRRQLPSGALSGSWGPGAAYYAGRELTWAVKHFLDASLLQVQAAFAASDAPVFDQIDPCDGRALVLCRWCGDLPRDASVLEMGCGRGRFLRLLRRYMPNASLMGIDPVPSLLDDLPMGVQTRQGTLLRIPAHDGAFDAALAVESLEHALVPQRAVDELCRVVRPGGRVLVIDKHRKQQSLSDHQPWERWFLPVQVSRWLERHCGDVSVEQISPGNGSRTSGPYLCWTGVRRPSGAAAAGHRTRHAA